MSHLRTAMNNNKQNPNVGEENGEEERFMSERLPSSESPSNKTRVLNLLHQSRACKLIVVIVTVIVAIAIALGVSSMYWRSDSLHVHKRYPPTMRHLTDGETEEGIPDPAPSGRGPEIIAYQATPFCSHSGNGQYSASSRYSGNYRGLRAFQGPRSSWSSKSLYADSFEPQWIAARFEKRRRVKSVSFGGSVSYPENTPTRYELHAFNDSTNSWVRLMQASHPAVLGHKRRKHSVAKNNRGLYDHYRLVLNQTVWMEKNSLWGYVQVSFLELCWEQEDDSAVPNPLEQTYPKKPGPPPSPPSLFSSSLATEAISHTEMTQLTSTVKRSSGDDEKPTLAGPDSEHRIIDEGGGAGGGELGSPSDENISARCLPNEISNFFIIICAIAYHF